MKKKNILVWLGLAVLTLTFGATIGWLQPKRVHKLEHIHALLYQLKDYGSDFSARHSSDRDTLFVLDRKFLRDDIQLLKKSGSNLVLAHLKVTEAEGALPGVLDSGFDGVFLSEVDAYQKRAGQYPDAAREMVEGIGRIGALARKRNRAFLVIPQNAACLPDPMTFPSADDTELKTMSRLYFGSIDAILVESTFFPIPRLEVLKCLESFPGQAKRIFGIEYVHDPIEQQQALAQFAAHQFVGQVIPSHSPAPR